MLQRVKSLDKIWGLHNCIIHEFSTVVARLNYLNLNFICPNNLQFQVLECPVIFKNKVTNHFYG